MKSITYIVTYSYNAGLLGMYADFNTYEEAKAFAADYMKNFDDCNKFYRIARHEVRKFLGITLSHEVQELESVEED